MRRCDFLSPIQGERVEIDDSCNAGNKGACNESRKHHLRRFQRVLTAIVGATVLATFGVQAASGDFSREAAGADLSREAAGVDSSRELDLKVGPSTRLLVLAPHPDDEVLGAAGLVRRVVAAGGSVRVALMTSGDAFPEGVELATHIRRPKPRDFRNYGSLRERETIAAMQILGLNRAHILFLGFPDGGMCLISSEDVSRKAAFESPYTGRIEPPPSEQLIRGVTYRGSDVRRELKSLLIAYQPTLVVLPHPEDLHPDHCATSIFGAKALETIARTVRPSPRVLRYLIHYDRWPNLDDDRAVPLGPPPAFPPAEGEWRTLTLTPAEAALKQRAIAAYPSQALVIGRLMHAFERPNELFVEGPVLSRHECWCDATHVATDAALAGDRRSPPPRR
jgi:LmbE family N-acetylglucosaminyl deacetylase